MENQANFLDPLIEKARVYGKTSLDLYKLKAIDKTSEVSSTIISRILAFAFIALFILMSSLGAAFWLGNFFGELYYGFFCVGGFYGVLGVVLYFFLHGWMKERTSNSIVKQMLN
jgi:phosphoglycerol transferase MdoB-like AlkP superfamily enzyme